MLTWHQTRNGIAVTGLGHQALLDVPMTAFFASRLCPGSAMRSMGKPRTISYQTHRFVAVATYFNRLKIAEHFSFVIPTAFSLRGGVGEIHFACLVANVLWIPVPLGTRE